ncbi:MAG: Mu transposase C-terminal domain-containing protein [Sideroxyarcus sp.]|nr:Mu transposase C-terminal domain-containing protein [Sideroxyarcus sp.]
MALGEIKLIPGYTVLYQGKQYVILDIAGLDAVIAKEAVSGKTERLPVNQLMPDLVVGKKVVRQDLLTVKDEDWLEARQRFEQIRPLLMLSGGNRTKEKVKRVAEENEVNTATIYRWISAYEKTELVSSLLRSTRKDAGSSRLDPEVEKVMREVIENEYLTEEQPSPSDVWDSIKERCLKLKLPTPHQNTLRNRIALLSEEKKLEKRKGKKAAKEKFTPHKGSFPGADYPLAVEQIDHTPMDVIVVDDQDRKPIGRPYLTLAIDVHSKMVGGYYISLDPPGALSTGLCITHAVLPKDQWLAKMDISTPWPVWGRMRVIHTDNAKEFRGTMLSKACDEHNIQLEQRPKGEPQYGGHIERSFRTYMSKVHTLPGTTRSNVQDKGEYDSEGNACMTLAALEKWFAIFIVEYYHQKPHKGNNGVPPIVVWERGILGSEDSPGVGLPSRITDETKFKLDFLPFEMRTIQEYGVVIEDIYYYHPALQPWMHAIDPDDIKRKRKFICRYDPRDLSTIYFLDPDTKEYAAIPYRDITRPPISIWELRAAKKQLADEGYTVINEELIFGAVRKMKDIVSSEKAITKKVRKQQARSKGWKKSKEHIPPPAQETNDTSSAVDDDIFSKPITAFDIQEAS